MNSPFVGYGELSRSRRGLSTLAFDFGGYITPSSICLIVHIYPTQPHSLIAKYRYDAMTLEARSPLCQ